MVFGLVWGGCLGCFGAVMGLCGFGYLVGVLFCYAYCVWWFELGFGC